MLNITSNIAAFSRDLNRFANKQLPFALSLALNETGKDLIDHNKAEMARVFDRPTRWTLNAFHFRRATKQRPQLTIERKRLQRGRHYLEVQAKGGTRSTTGREAQIAGHVGRSVGYVSAPKLRRNAHGNIGRATMQRVLEGIGGAKYFIPRSGSKLAPGVYLRKRKGVSRVLAFNSEVPNYRRRYDFDRIMKGRAEQVMPGNMRAAMRRALATARS